MMFWHMANLHETMVIMGPNEVWHFFYGHGDEDVFDVIWDCHLRPFWRHLGGLGHTFGSMGCPERSLESIPRGLEKQGRFPDSRHELWGKPPLP